MTVGRTNSQCSMMDLQQPLGIAAIAVLALIAGGAVGFFLSKDRRPTVTALEQPAIGSFDHVQPPKTEISPLELRYQLLRWRDRFHIELEKVTESQVKKIDDALSEKSTWWALFWMKSASEALDHVLTDALLEISGTADRLMNLLVEQCVVSVVVKDVYKFDPSSLLMSLEGIRFLTPNRDKISKHIQSAFLGANGVLTHYVSQSNQLIKKACAQL